MVGDEFEGLAYRGFGPGGGQPYRPSEIAGDGIEIGDFLDARGVGGDFGLAHAHEFAQDQQRFVAGGKQGFMRGEIDAPLARIARRLGVEQSVIHAFSGLRRAAGELLQPGFYICAETVGGAGVIAGGMHHLRDDVGGFQQRVDHFARRGDPAFAHGIQQRFQHMGEIGDIVEAEGAGAALDRMGAAENGVQRFLVRRFHVEREQALLHLHQQLEAFGDVGLFELVKAGCHRLKPPLPSAGRLF